MKKRIYIAGKVTGTNQEECSKKFKEAEEQLINLGFEAVNPLTTVGDWNTPWNKAMRLCIIDIMRCDAMVLLPDWQQSKGAITEFNLANTIDMPIFNYSAFGLNVMCKNLE